MPKLVPRADLSLKKISLRYDCSKLFHSFNDTEKNAKVKMNEDNPLAIVPSSLGGNIRGPASIDWLLLLNEGNMILTKCKGLRNVPSVQTHFSKIRQINFSADLLQNASISRILSVTMARPGSYDDVFNLMALSDDTTNMFKCSVDLKTKD